jgi:hypothetical protein
MNTSNQSIFQNLVTTNPFAATSRYFGIPTATMAAPDGSMITYVRRRFIPPPETYSLLFNYTVVDGDRLDNITAKYFGDPEQFWRIADANNVLDADELTATPGKQIRITLPRGVPGQPPNA